MTIQSLYCSPCETVHPAGYRCYVGAATIDEWYDRHSKNWIVQLKDAEGNQLGDAEYSGTRASSTYVVKMMLKDAPFLKLTKKN